MNRRRRSSPGMLLSSSLRTRQRACRCKRKSPPLPPDTITWTLAPFATSTSTVGSPNFCRVCTPFARNVYLPPPGIWPWQRRQTPWLTARPNHVSHFVYKHYGWKEVSVDRCRQKSGISPLFRNTSLTLCMFVSCFMTVKAYYSVDK